LAASTVPQHTAAATGAGTSLVAADEPHPQPAVALVPAASGSKVGWLSVTAELLI